MSLFLNYLMTVSGANAQYAGGAGDSSFATRPAKLPVSAPGKVAAPATNLNIGMDLWSPPPAAGVPMKGRPATVSPGPDQMWISVSNMNFFAHLVDYILPIRRSIYYPFLPSKDS